VGLNLPRLKPRFTTPAWNSENRLKLSVCVRANFAVQIDLFVLRGCPFHELGSFRVLATNNNPENNTTLTVAKRENTWKIIK
jgi:hypothetical protein